MVGVAALVEAEEVDDATEDTTAIELDDRSADTEADVDRYGWNSLKVDRYTESDISLCLRPVSKAFSNICVLPE
ncbi:unnamed protein product [Alternaria alternata]